MSEVWIETREDIEARVAALKMQPHTAVAAPVSTDAQARRHLIEHHLQHIERHTKELRRILQEQP